MEQKSNKIQIPTKTKIVAITTIICGGVLSLLNILFCLSHDTIPFTDWREYAIIGGLIFVAISLLRKYKFGWFAEMAILYFGILFFGYFALVSLKPINNNYAYAWANSGPCYECLAFSIFMLLANILFFVFLLVDRKNYFAAVKRARDEKGGERVN